MRILFALPVASFLAISFAAQSSEAGWQSSDAAGCTKAADGSGNCYGSFLGFRNNSDPGAYVNFNGFGTSSVTFGAQLNGQFYSCAGNASVNNMTATLLLAKSWFQIYWDKTGTCTTVFLMNHSAYGNY